MKIKCPSCQAVLNIPPEAAGKLVKCPCGTQLRAPSAPAGAAAKSKPGVASGAAAGQAVQRRPAAPTTVDAGLFDELTEGDLQPISQAGVPAVGPAGSGNTNKLLQEHAATAGGGSGGNFRVGPLASPWIRLGAAIIDSVIINVIAGIPIFVIAFFTFGAALFSLDAIMQDSASTDAEKEQLATGVLSVTGLIGFGGIAVVLSITVGIYAWMVTKTGQTPGKKLCKIRIVRADNKQLPGFVQGVLIRSWAWQLILLIPVVSLIGLPGVLMIFGERRQCLYDIMAGTIVVES